MADGLSYQNVVKRDNGKLGILFPIFSITALVIFIVFFNAIPILLGINIIYFTGMISFGLSYLVYRLIKNQNVVFDITSDGDDLTINRIKGGRKRGLRHRNRSGASKDTGSGVWVHGSLTMRTA